MKLSARLVCWCAGMGFALLAASPSLAQVDVGPVTASGSAEVGVIPQSVPYNDVAKFQEYRDLAQQVIAPELKLLLGDKEENYYFDFGAINVGQKNEMYNLRFGKYGLLDVQAQWEEIPHFFSDDVAKSPYVEHGGTFSLLSRPSAPPPGGGLNVRDWLNKTATPLDLSLLYGISNLNIRFTPTSYATLSGYFNFINPSGERAFGSMFGSSPGSFNITELFEPIEYDIYNYGVGLELARHGWSVGFKYDGSFFRNQFDTLVWANPDTWGEMTGPGGTCVDSASYTPTTTGKGPCNGIRAMFPDNQAHTFSLTAGAVLPLNTHLMFDASYGFWYQNAPFVPFTANTALAQALPRTSLGGLVHPAYVNATIVSNPIEPLELKAKYSYYDYDNETPTIPLGSVATPVKSINDVSSAWHAVAFPFAFSTQDINLEQSYKITKDLAGRFVTDIRSYHNKGLMVPDQTQTSYGPVLDWDFYPWLQFRGSYQHSFKDSPNYNNDRESLVANNAFSEEELSELFRFDEASVYVDQFELYAQAMPREDLTLYSAMDYDNYSYPSSKAGRQHYSTYTPSVGAVYNPLPYVNLFADYAWQATDWHLRSLQRSSGTQTLESNPLRVWESLGRNQGSSFDFGFDARIPKNRYLRNESRFRVQYTYAVGTDTIHAWGDKEGLPPSPGFAGGATNFPDVGSQFHELIAQYEYELHKNLSLKFGYYFSHYGENDWGVDNMVPWMGSLSFPTSAFASASMFLGDRIKAPYNANVGFITFKLKF